MLTNITRTNQTLSTQILLQMSRKKSLVIVCFTSVAEGCKEFVIMTCQRDYNKVFCPYKRSQLSSKTIQTLSAKIDSRNLLDAEKSDTSSYESVMSSISTTMNKKTKKSNKFCEKTQHQIDINTANSFDVLQKIWIQWFKVVKS